jgi:hypothetical protein
MLKNNCEEPALMAKFRPVIVSTLLLCGLASAQKQTDWMNVSNSPEIEYRVQLFEDAKTCYLDFRDKKQGKGYTTFDAAVDYKWADPQQDDQQNQQSQKIKTETEHLTTAPTQTAGARISECSGVAEIKVNYIQRH